jgi:hypothetical protein
MIAHHETPEGLTVELEIWPFYGQIIAAWDTEYGWTVENPPMGQDEINSIAAELYALGEP